MLYIDLDDFKAVNDGMGHDTGDELIRAAAERIRASIARGDTVARLGGDEFAVLIEDTLTGDDVDAASRGLIEMLRAADRGEGGSAWPVPASIGVTYATRESNVESLLRDADIAMYRAKSFQARAR